MTNAQKSCALNIQNTLKKIQILNKNNLIKAYNKKKFKNIDMCHGYLKCNILELKTKYYYATGGNHMCFKYMIDNIVTLHINTLHHNTFSHLQK